MNNLFSKFLSFKNTIVTFDFERKPLIRMIKHCVKENGVGIRLLDVGCGYGRNIDTVTKFSDVCIGVDVNAEIVQANKKRGLVVFCA